MVCDAPGLLRHLLDNGSPFVAGGLAGSFRRIGRPAMADEIAGAIRANWPRVHILLRGNGHYAKPEVLSW